MDKKTIEKLIDTAIAQLDFSYAPYSASMSVQLF